MGPRMHKDVLPIFVGDADAAAPLGISRNGFLNGVRNGTLPPPKKLGRRSLWELAELVEAVRGTSLATESNTGHKIPPPAEPEALP